MARKNEDGKPKRGKGNIVVWAVLGLLILALGGFGIGNFGGHQRAVATVGAVEVPIEDYARALQQEQQRLSQTTGQALTAPQMAALGLDRRVLEQLLGAAALDDEARRLGVSVDDATVAERIRAIPAFAGTAGGFDREAYGYALRSAGLDERGFERSVRSEAAREVLQTALVGGVDAPPGYAERIAAYLAETRDLTVGVVTPDDLDGDVPAPSDSDIAAFYDANPDRFRRPERRRVTFAAARPDAAVEVSEDDLRAAYDARAEDYRLPKRILAERLAFRDGEAAQAAADRIAAGEATFAALVEERGLTTADVDQGELREDDVPPDVAAALFALDAPGVVGPVDTPLGPALYDVGAVLNAREIPFDEVRDDLAAEIAAREARAEIDAARDDIDDLLAGGATIEELAGETPMTLGTATVDAETADGPMDDPAFRDAVLAAQDGDFPERIDLDDGGVAAFRLDGIDPPAVPPLDEIRDEVEAAWLSDAMADRLEARAEAVADALRAGGTFEAAGIDATAHEGISRDVPAGDAPAEAVARTFDLGAGDVAVARGDGERAFVIRVDAVGEADPASEETAALIDAVRAQARQDMAQDIAAAYATAVRDDVGFDVNTAAIQAVQTQSVGR